MIRIKPVRITAKNCFDKSRYAKPWEEVKKATPLSGRVCERCGSSDRLERDHIVPVSKGGQHAISNIQILCFRCHDLKHPHRAKRRKKKC